MFLKKIMLSASLLIAGAAFTNRCIAQLPKASGSEVIYNGNKFKLAANGTKDTLHVQDPLTGRAKRIVTVLPAQPVSMNGQEIYDWNRVTTQPQPIGASLALEDHLLLRIIEVFNFSKLPDGIITMNLGNIIIDTKGKLVYYYYDENNVHYANSKEKTIRTLTANASKMDTIIANAPLMEPAALNGVKVIARLDLSLKNYKIEVADHVVTYHKISPGIEERY